MRGGFCKFLSLIVKHFLDRKMQVRMLDFLLCLFLSVILAAYLWSLEMTKEEVDSYAEGYETGYKVGLTEGFMRYYTDTLKH